MYSVKHILLNILYQIMKSWQLTIQCKITLLAYRVKPIEKTADGVTEKTLNARLDIMHLGKR